MPEMRKLVLSEYGYMILCLRLATEGERVVSHLPDDVRFVSRGTLPPLWRVMVYDRVAVIYQPWQIADRVFTEELEELVCPTT